MAVKKRKPAGANVRRVVKKVTSSVAKAKATTKTKASKARVKKVARTSSRAAGKHPRCNVKPASPGPFTFPAQGGSFEIFVVYPTPPDACPYTAKPNVRWITTNPRISEFDAILTPNPGPAREGIVWVRGEGNPKKHKVVIRQMSAS